MGTARKNNTGKRITLGEVCEAFGEIAPLELAQSWDNVGLLAGDTSQSVRKVLFCIDLTPVVADEAIAKSVDAVMAYHPPIFKPVSRLTAQSGGPEAAVFRCIAKGIAIYSMHTALDAAEGGTCDVIAGFCGIADTLPLEYLDTVGASECKVVVFVPAESVEAVANTMSAAGAGVIGEYTKCSYRLDGYGTFLGSDASNPAVGKAGQYERVEEIRLEMVCPKQKIPQVCDALAAAHPYEEPAYDIYPLSNHPKRGSGRYGKLSKPMELSALAKKLKKLTKANCVQIVGEAERKIERAVILVGAAGSMPFKIPLTESDVIVTGEIRHHDALTILRKGCSAIALNHWTSERPTMQVVADRLAKRLPGITTMLSESDCEPFRMV